MAHTILDEVAREARAIPGFMTPVNWDWAVGVRVGVGAGTAL